LHITLTPVIEHILKTLKYHNLLLDLFFRLFADTAHDDMSPVQIGREKQSELAKCSLDMHQLGIWIDPIGEKIV